MPDSSKLPPAATRAINRAITDFGGKNEQFRQQLGPDRIDTGAIDPLADFLLEKADYLEAVGGIGLPPGQDARSLYLRRRRNLLYRFVFPRDNELSEPGGSSDEVRAFEKRVPVRLTPEENATLVEQVNEELRSPTASTYLGDPLTAGAVRYDSRLGLPRASGPILDPTAAPTERPPLSEMDERAPRPTPSAGSTPNPSRTSEDFTRPALLRDASVSKPSFTTSYVMMRMRPGEKRTQKIELPGVTLNLTVSVS
jgi:hypothetical protein